MKEMVRMRNDFGGAISRATAALLACLLLSPVFGQDARPHVVFIAGEDEYGSHWALPKIADDLQRRFNIRSTVIHAWRSGVHDYDMPGKVDIPETERIENLEVIRDADLIVLHIRFLIPPPEQYAILQEYFDSGKPAIALRTTSHGFWPQERKGWFVPFFGGHYKGHMPSTEGTTTMVPADQIEHPILRGVPKMHYMNDVMGIYVTAPLNDSATPLMMGKTGLIGPAQPVTWINEYRKGQRLFYTSLGGLESFLSPGFINMLYNAVYWCLGREIPEHGVLTIDELSDFEEDAPFEKDAFGEVKENPFDLPPHRLEPENAIVLRSDFRTSTNVPPPPKPNIPDNAVVLFDGKDLSKWRHWDLSANPIAMLPDTRAVTPSPPFDDARWRIVDHTLEARPGFGSILTKETYGNYKLHVDFLIPEEPDYIPDHYKGSGGIYLDGRYEIKILDSYGKAVSKTSNGAIFNQVAPAENASKPVNTWQSLDITYRHYENQRPVVSVTLNGAKIHHNVTILARSPLAIREDDPYFISSEKDGAGAYNMNVDGWAAEVVFRTVSGGYLVTNAPKNARWNEDSRGLWVGDGRLVYRSGRERRIVGGSDAARIDDGQWHRVVLAADKGNVDVYLDGQHVDRIPNKGSQSLNGHVLRIGQGADIFRLGASALPSAYRDERFDGEIKSVRFFRKALDASEIMQIADGEKVPGKLLSLDWKAVVKPGNIRRGPIRIQSDVSKIRYANIWLQSLDEPK